MDLVLGVVDQAYSDASSGVKTTGEVATILEDKYHVMMTFFETRKEQIDALLADAFSEQVQMMFGQSGYGGNAMVEATENINQLFREFLDANEMAHLVASLTTSELDYYMGATGGAFTGAGSRGVSHRKKKPYAKQNAARPAFIDTGLYRSSFRSWIEK